MNRFSSFTSPTPRPHAGIAVSDDLFAWRGGEIVLMGERDGASWILARGWRTGDRLTDIRRWTFADDVRFVAQVRRLVFEATRDPRHAASAASAVADWVQLQR